MLCSLCSQLSEPRLFLQLYKELNGKWDKMKSLPVKKSNPNGEKWDHHRNDYCKRRISMISRAKKL